MEHKAKKKSKLRTVSRALGFGIGAGVIFLSGFGIGNGRIILSREQLFRKSVQQTAPADLDYSSVEQVYDALRKEYDGQLDVEKLLDGLKSGLADAAGDPYTEFLNKDSAKEFDSQLNGTFSGIGAELSKDEDGNIVVISPIAGYPAEKAGLKPKDIVVKVDGEALGKATITEAVNKIRGEAGSKVKLTVVRDKAKELEFEITREQIKVPSVKWEIKNGSIGYLQISRFAEDTADLATQAAKEFKSKNMKGVVLDVRGDPGGLLSAAVDVSSLWLPAGNTVLQEKRNDVVVQTYRAKGNPILQGIPTVVLINEGSASASEITAGALKDNGAATLIGKKSFGKGSVQSLEKFTDGTVLKVTIARWYTPDGININKEGIKPDTEVERTTKDFEKQRDPQLDAALKALR